MTKLVLPMPAMRFSGWFYVELVDAATGVVKQKLSFPNLITNAGLDAWGGASVFTFSTLFNGSSYYCAVGTGSTAPNVSDVTLVTEVSPSSTHRTNSDGGFTSGSPAYTVGPPDYWSRQRTFVFSTAQANGNLTELGIFTANTGGTMWTRQLFKDGGGVPTTVIKTSAEELRIVYELRVQPMQSDVSSTISVSGTNYDYTVRAMEVDDTTFWGAIFDLGGVFGNSGINHATAFETQTLSTRTGNGPSGTTGDSTSVTPSAYSNGTYYRDYTAVWGAAAANFASGIGSAKLLSLTITGNEKPLYQVSFAASAGGTRIPKDNTKQLTLVFRHSFVGV